jgi:hypothetical protein
LIFAQSVLLGFGLMALLGTCNICVRKYEYNTGNEDNIAPKQDIYCPRNNLMFRLEFIYF